MSNKLTAAEAFHYFDCLHILISGIKEHMPSEHRAKVLSDWDKARVFKPAVESNLDEAAITKKVAQQCIDICVSNQYEGLHNYNGGSLGAAGLIADHFKIT